MSVRRHGMDEGLGRDLAHRRISVKRSLVQTEILYYLNFSAAFVQTLSGIIVIVTTNSENKYTVYSTFPAYVNDSNTFLVPVPKELFSISIGYLAAVYLFISAFDHFFVCTIGKRAYENGLNQNHNIFRWIEYAFSASLMKVIVGLLCGIADLNTLILIFGHSVVTMIFGLIFELENGSDRRMEHSVRWYIYWLAFIPHTYVWVTILTHLAVYNTSNHTPGIALHIVIAMFLLDLAFAITLRLQWRCKGVFRPYGSGEIAFTILSLTSKNVLACMNFIHAN